MLANQRSLDMYALTSDKPRYVIEGMPPEPVKRGPQGLTGVPLESDVLKAIVDGLRRHRMVGLVQRVNSGTAIEGRDGDHRYITYNHVYSVPEHDKLRASDLSCTLKNGPWAGRRFDIECKRPGWKSPHGEREAEQAEYLQVVRECGGYAIFATSWEDVFHELNRIRLSFQQRPTE